MGVLDFFKTSKDIDNKKQITDKNYVNTLNRIDKKNSLIEGRYKLNVYEIRIFNYLVSKVGKEDKEFSEYELTFEQIIQGCKLNRGNCADNDYKLIKKTVRKLKDRSIEIENEKEWKVLSLFDVARIPHGTKVIHFQIGREIMPLLLSIKGQYTTLHLDSILELNSIFAIRFYEISMKHLYHNTNSWKYILSVEEIKHRFELEDKYQRFYNFKQRVLEAACTEINQKTHINLTYKLIPFAHDKRKIERIEFTVTRKNKEETKKIENKQLPVAITRLKELKVGKAEKLYKQISKAIKCKEIKNYTDTDAWFNDFFNNWQQTIETKKTETGQEIKNISAYIKTLIEEQTISTVKQETEKEKKKQQDKIEKTKREKEQKTQKVEKLIDVHLQKQHHTYTEQDHQNYTDTLKPIWTQQECKKNTASISDIYNNYSKDSEEYKSLRFFVYKINAQLQQEINNE